MKNSTLKAPAHLRPDTRAWWLYVHSNWRLEAHHSRLLEMACDAWDRYHEARVILARDGIVVGGRQAAVRPHPCIAIERDNRIVFARLIAQLNLDGDPSEVRGSGTVRDSEKGCASHEQAGGSIQKMNKPTPNEIEAVIAEWIAACSPDPMRLKHISLVGLRLRSRR
jgi:Phage terminase, small subunit